MTRLEALKEAERIGLSDHRSSTDEQDAVTRALIPEGATFADWGLVNKILTEGSLDAAKALHEKVLPGWQCSLAFDENHAGAGVAVTGSIQSADNACPARAWLLAILRALISQHPDNEGNGHADD